MLQQRLIFQGYHQISASEPPQRGLRRVVQVLRSAELRIGGIVMATLLTFGVIAVRPGSGYPTMQLLLTYNAVVLGYLSAFWGLWADDLDRSDGLPYSPRRIALAERERLLWSIAPTVLGGSGMLLPLILPQDIGTLMLVTGFALLVTLEELGQRRGVAPADFKWLRWSVSIFAVFVLIDVLADQRWDFRIFF